MNQPPQTFKYLQGAEKVIRTWRCDSLEDDFNDRGSAFQLTHLLPSNLKTPFVWPADVPDKFKVAKETHTLIHTDKHLLTTAEGGISYLLFPED